MKVPVLIPRIFDHPHTYLSEKYGKLKTGSIVSVPFGKEEEIGVVWDKEENTNKNFKLRNIKEKKGVSLSHNLVRFINWFSLYNLAPKGMVLKMCLGDESFFSKKKETFNNIIKTKSNFILNEEQKKCLQEINNLGTKFSTTLLQGITGSGKTIVYFEKIKENILKGRQSLVLLPEIFLTNQFNKRFEDYFGFKPAIWHSKITKKNKRIIWKNIINGEIKLVVGARSSLFLPFKNLGLIVVDEEHDSSYKQDEGIRYNARDMAISRASIENIPVLLSTSIPSLETFNNVKNKKYNFTKLEKRYKNFSLPNAEVVDLKLDRKKKNIWLDPKTINFVKKYLEKKDQVLFFLNRRGFSPFVFCKKCLKVFACPNCSINLVYHKIKKNLLCHYCGHNSSLARECKKNEKCEIIFSGPGVERISEEVKKIFPEYKSLIFSSDTMNKKSSSLKLEDITQNKINILIGTQLISKGFHFPFLNCIVVLDIDLCFQGYDLRSAEKNLQLYHQLSGRAGREGKTSFIYFQTYNLEKKIISKLTHEDPFIFLKNELELRKKNFLPPFERFISIIISSSNAVTLEKESNNLKEFLSEKIDARILGPVNAPIYKIRNKFRNRLLIRAAKTLKIQDTLSYALNKFKLSKGIKLIVDVDPINFN